MNQLPKVERLSGKSSIQHLFRKGRRFRIDPFSVIWILRTESAEIPVRFGISVSKKISKKAVERNKIKRQVREAYRTTKQALSEQLTNNEKQIDFFLVYNGEIHTHTDILREKIILILNRLNALHGQTPRSDNHRTD
jgi:ribonuclease P protein component